MWPETTVRVRIRIRADGGIADAMGQLLISTRGALGRSATLDHGPVWTPYHFPGRLREYGQKWRLLWRQILEATRRAPPGLVSLGLAAAEEAAVAPASEKDVREELCRPLFGCGPAYVVAVIFTSLVVLGGLACWNYQSGAGLGVAGSHRPVMGSLYLVSFAFWLGISTAGATVSAILRLVDAGWRGPVTRTAEMMTIFALLVAAVFPVINLGRAAAVPGLLFSLNFGSPLLWGALALLAYFTVSAVYACLSLRTDAAELEPRLLGWQRGLYRFLSFRWPNSSRTTKSMTAVVPLFAVAASVAAAWCFSHDVLFGLRFVTAGALSGIAALILLLAVIRKTLRLEAYLEAVHFEKLGRLLVAISVLWFGFVAAERRLTLVTGGVMVLCSFVLPLLLQNLRRLRSIATATAAAGSALLGIWLDHYRTVAGGDYSPTWIEVSITAAGLAGFVLLYLIFSRLFPLIAVWEYSGSSRNPSC
jgi:Ni/Fe-hydrogenase subunit HybB-like protein